MAEYWSDFYQQKHNQINGRNVWLWLCSTPIGNIFLVQYEEKEQYLTTFTFYNDPDKAERKFKQICNRIINETL